MIVGKRTYLFTDATVNIDPSAEDLADIAFLVADFATPAAAGTARGTAFLLQFWQHPPSSIGEGAEGGGAHPQPRVLTSLWMVRCRRILPWCRS